MFHVSLNLPAHTDSQITNTSAEMLTFMRNGESERQNCGVALPKLEHCKGLEERRKIISGFDRYDCKLEPAIGGY